MNQRRHKRNKLKSWYVWHRYAGITAAVFIILITLSGIALNHTDALNLSQQHLSNGWLLKQYNIKEPLNVTSFQVSKGRITQVDNLLFANNDLVTSAEQTITGVVSFNGLQLIGFHHELILLDDSNHLVETLTSEDGLPANMSRIGTDSNGAIVIQAAAHYYQLNDQLHAVKSTPGTTTWSAPVSLTAAQKKQAIELYQSNIISIETFILDLHSGRYLGEYGQFFFDFVGLILLFLAFSGLYIWVVQRKKNT